MTHRRDTMRSYVLGISLLLLDWVLMHVDEVLAQVLGGSEGCATMGAGVVVRRRLMHGGDVFLQVIKVTDELGAEWARLRDLT